MAIAASMTMDALPTDKRLAEERMRASARTVAGGLLQSEFHVPRMHCIGCVRRIETGLDALAGVKAVRANLSTRRVVATWAPTETFGVLLSEELGRQGFDHVLLETGTLSVNESDGQLKNLLLCLGVAGFAAANVMLLSISVWSGAEGETRQLFHLLSGLIAVPAVTFAGRPFFSSALNSLSHWRFNMDVPISLAIVLALGMSVWESVTGGAHAYFDAALMLLFFLLIGRTLDHMMRERARNAVKLLAQLAAKGAVRVDCHGKQAYVAANELVPGDRILVAAGERVPVDGIVRGSASEVDRSLVTGESALVQVRDGAAVEAGTVNQLRPLTIEVAKRAGESFLAEVITMMEAAENGKAKYRRIADRAAAVYAPAVHLVSFVTFLSWLFATRGDWHTSLFVAISVLIITCPCALGLAVPIVHVLGAGRLFERGVLIKDGSAFERLSEVDTVVFDKTGTLTMGEPTVTSCDATDLQKSRAAALARHSRHPVALAITRAFSDKITHFNGTIDDVREVPGFGVEATIDGGRVRLGRATWVRDILTDAGLLEGDYGTTTTVYFAEESGKLATFALDDAVRPEAVATIAALKSAGFAPVILSGDAPAAVRQTAGLVGIETFYSEQTPADKVAYLKVLQDRGRKVLMVGDGINDAPALAFAHVSMAPSSGSDVGRQAADFVLTGLTLSAVSFAREIALRTDRLARQNIAIAIAYNCIAVPLACAGMVTPLIAAIAMSASSIVVVLNSMRLQFAGRAAGEHILAKSSVRAQSSRMATAAMEVQA